MPLQSLDKKKTSQGGQKATEDKACKKAKVTRGIVDDSQSDGVLLASCLELQVSHDSESHDPEA
eukprot:8900377-Heterocapsa_arctica.AAC.1